MSDEKQLARAVLQSGLTSLCGEQELDAVLKSDHTVNIPVQHSCLTGLNRTLKPMVIYIYLYISPIYILFYISLHTHTHTYI